MKKVLDISNYDADHDMRLSPMWATEFLAAGVDGIIIGSQNPDMAAWQSKCAKDAGLPILGSYAEPNVGTAITRAHMDGAKYVGLACETGGISSRPELRQAVVRVKNAGLIPLIYANAGDYAAIAGPEFDGELRWLANYGMDDPDNPRAPIEDVDVHQYSSTIVVAGRVRDHNYWMIPDEEDDMTPQESEDLKNLVAIMGGSAKIKENAERGNDFILGYSLEQQKLGEHIADKAAHQ